MTRPRTRRPMHITICLAAILTVAAEAVWFFGLAIVMAVFSERVETPAETRNDVLAIDEHGTPLRVTNIYRFESTIFGGWSNEVHDLEGNAVDLKQLKLSDRIVTLADLRLFPVAKRWSVRERIRPLNHLDDAQSFFRDTGHDGYFEFYSRENGQRMGYLGRNGYVETQPPPAERFPTRSGADRGVLTPWFSTWDVSHTLPNGTVSGDVEQSPWIQTSLEIDGRYRFVEPGGRRVHFLDPRRRRVLGVIEVESEPVQAVGWLWLHKAAVSPVILRTATTLLVCSQDGAPQVVRSVTLPEPVRNAGVLQWLPLGDPLAGGGENLFIQLLDKDWRLIWSDDAGHIQREKRIADFSNHFSVDVPSGWEAWALAAVQSPLPVDLGVWIGHDWHPWRRALALHRAAEFDLSVPSTPGAGPFVEAAAWPLVALHLSGAFWSVLAWRRLRRFGGSRFDRGFWFVWTLAFGLPGYLAFRAHRTWELHAGVGRALLPVASPEMLTGKSARPTFATAALLSAYEKFLDAGEHCGAAIAARVGLPAGHTALLLKELRLTMGMAVLSLFAYWLVVASSVGVRGFTWLREDLPVSGGGPFVQGGIVEPFMAITIVLAVGLAVWQIVTEARHQAWLFVLHRPVSHRAILVSKMAVGLSVLMGCSAMPIVLSGVLASQPGMVAAPFEWSMTADVWRCWWSLSTVYLAMLLSMLRPARWIGTKAFPVVGAFAWLVVRDSLGIATEPAWFEFVAVTAFDAILIACLLLVIREREYA